MRERWFCAPPNALDKYLAEVAPPPAATAPEQQAGAPLPKLREWTVRLVRRRPLEVYISTLCAAHLVLLLLLLALLPSDALPPAHLLGSERPQQFAGLLALAALVVFAATDALLIYWLQRRNRPLKPLQAWAVWWAFVVTIIALVDSLLIRSYGLLISTAFAGPILLAALCGHRAWADDAYRFVESWQQVEAAWHGTDAAIAHAATIVTAEVVVEEVSQKE